MARHRRTSARDRAMSADRVAPRNRAIAVVVVALIALLVLGTVAATVGTGGAVQAAGAGPTTPPVGTAPASPEPTAEATPSQAAESPSQAAESPSPTAPATVPPDQALTAALDRALGGTAGNVSVAVVDHRTGATYTYHPGQRYVTASIVKVGILATLLLDAQQSGRTLTADERALATDMITKSDNDAASELWDDIGGEDGLAAADTRFGLTATEPGTDGVWGCTTTTVTDQIRLLDTVTRAGGPLSAPSLGLLTGLLGAIEPDQVWGVSSAVRPGEQLLLKNGWLEDGEVGAWTVNSIGGITGPGGTDVTIAVLTTGNASMEAGVSTIETVVRLTRQYLGW